MRNFKINRRATKGFTLVELLLAMVVGAMIMLAVYLSMAVSQRTSANVGGKVITQQDTRAVLDIMAAEISMASFNPTTRVTTWQGANIAQAVNCINPPIVANPANRGILLAEPNRLYIAMDLNEDGVIGSAQNEYILYSYDFINRAITRNVSCGGNVAILGGAALGSNVINGAPDVNIPLFRYFDRQGQLMNPPINIPAIRRIKITIVAETAAVDLHTNQRRRMIYSTDVLVRNHAAFTPSP